MGLCCLGVTRGLRTTLTLWSELRTTWLLVCCNQGGYIEVRHEHVSKGAFLEKILHRMMEQGKQVDFVLCIGDDPSDENMFAAAEAYGGKQSG